MFSDALTRRNFAVRIAPVLSALGLASLLPSPAVAKKKAGEDVRKLNDQGQPAEGTPMITPIVIHNRVAYIAGVGAHDTGPQESWEIGAHTTKVLDNIKKLVEAAGSTMENVVQLTVFLAKIDSYDGMNKVSKPISRREARRARRLRWRLSPAIRSSKSIALQRSSNKEWNRP